MRDAAERALARVEAQYRHRAWCKDVIGPAIEAAIEEVRVKEMMKQREEEEEAEEMFWRRKLELAAKSCKAKRVPRGQPTTRRTVVIRRKKTTKVEEAIPEPTTETTTLPGRRLRKIDILAEREEGVPLPTRQQQPFRLAPPTNWANWRQAVLGGEDDFVAERHDIGLRVDGDAMIRSHSEWERILATPKRRPEQPPPVETQHDEHSTGIFATIKTWATKLYGRVRQALWG